MVSWLELRRALDRFFFAPVPVLPVAVLRILLAIALLFDALMLWPERLTWFSDEGVLSHEVARQVLGGPRLDLFRLFWPRDPWSVTGLLLLHIAAALAMGLGFYTRAATVIVLLTTVTLHHRNYLILNSGDSVLRLYLFYLALSPAGRVLSLDAWLRRRRGLPREPDEDEPLMTAWPLRLMQLQLSLIYISATLWKLDGNAWLDGTALYFATRLTDFQRLPVPWVLDQLWALKLGTWLTLAIEAGLGVLVWIKETRHRILLLGLLLHLAIEWTMNIPVFEWLMMSLLVLFVDPAVLRGWLVRIGALAPRGPAQ